MLASDILPRHAVAGWLLRLLPSMAAAQSAKLALFLDWLGYRGRADNVMYAEPAVLLIAHTLARQPTVAATLLEFVCLAPATFCPPLKVAVVPCICI